MVFAIKTKISKKTWHRLTRIECVELFNSIIYKVPRGHKAETD